MCVLLPIHIVWPKDSFQLHGVFYLYTLMFSGQAFDLFFPASPPRQYITSTTVGHAFWKQLCAEHGIRPGTTHHEPASASLFFFFFSPSPFPLFSLDVATPAYTTDEY